MPKFQVNVYERVNVWRTGIVELDESDIEKVIADIVKSFGSSNVNPDNARHDAIYELLEDATHDMHIKSYNVEEVDIYFDEVN